MWIKGVDEGCGCAAATDLVATPLLQISFFPLLMQVCFRPLLIFVIPALLQLFPAIFAELATCNGVNINIRKIRLNMAIARCRT